jgi:hypothetical protein
MADGEIILYRSEDGLSELQLRAQDGSVWLSQSEIAELFQTTPQNVTQHVRTVYEEGELVEASTCKEVLQVRLEGSRDVKRTIKLYNLDVILGVGYRVRSPRGSQFRQWATTRLKEYLIKGFAIDETRLKGGERFDYFDELLEKIREIRASEKRFYQKVRDVYATSVDYDGHSEHAQKFFATVQNKMLHSVTGKTAAELVFSRADPQKPNMGLTSWKGSRVRKSDVTTAKNYLTDTEMTELNRIVTMFLDVAEDRAARRKEMTMAAWDTELDRFLAYNERPILRDAGRISHDRMEQIAEARYSEFDLNRKAAETEAAEIEHEEELKRIEKAVSSSKPSLRGNTS